MITIYQAADEPSRSPDRPCYYIAKAEWRGQSFTARARYGVINDLARQLVAAGAEDHFVEVRVEGIPGYIAHRSLHQLATRTIEEGPTTPLRDVKWRDPSEHFARLGGKAVLSQATASGGSLQPSPIHTPKMEPVL